MTNTATIPAATRLENFPIAFFSMIMGLTGLTLVWQKAAETFSLPGIIGQILQISSAAIFLMVVLIYVLKVMLKTQAVRDEFSHPIKLSFFPAFSISLLLTSIASLQSSPQLSLLLWCTGSSLHLLFTLYVLTQWIHHPKFQIAHSTPAWFIPIVGNILVPIAGVEHGFTELSWFFFSIGLIFWIVLKTLIFNRIIFHDPLPEKLLPTLFILIAPPAVGFISYTKLNGGLDNFGRILFYIAIFLLLLLLTQLPRFARIKFYISWWAYSFPLAAAAVAAQLFFSLTGALWLQYLSAALIALATGVIAMLFIRTIIAIVKGQICVPE